MSRAGQAQHEWKGNECAPASLDSNLNSFPYGIISFNKGRAKASKAAVGRGSCSMPYTTEFWNLGTRVIHTGEGVVSGKDILDGVALGFEAAQSGMPIKEALIDLSGVSEFRVAASDVKEIVAMDNKFASLVPRAFVALVAPKDLLFGMARMWEMQVERPGWTTHAFRTRGEAEAWLAEMGNLNPSKEGAPNA